MADDRRKGAGVLRYLKEAFTFKWNLLLFGGAVAAGFLSGAPDVVLPLIGAAELTYLAGLTSLPRFQAAIDARARLEERPLVGAGRVATPEDNQKKVGAVLASLDQEAKIRFLRLRARCVEMQRIANQVRGSTGDDRADELRAPALDRLLWTFLRLLYAQHALRRFLDATSEQEIRRQLESLKAREQALMAKPELERDERVLRSVRDTLATAELRLENYEKSKANAEFISIELDRIEGKIQTITEMAISHHDPDDIASQVDAVADGMQHTEQAIRELHTITGLSDELDAPRILETDLTEVAE